MSHLVARETLVYVPARQASQGWFCWIVGVPCVREPAGHTVTFLHEVVLIDSTNEVASITCASHTDCTYDVRYHDTGHSETHVQSTRIKRRPHDRNHCGMCQALARDGRKGANALCHRYFAQ